MDLSCSLKEMMENDSDDESEKINEAFICCVCRDLVHKPVVLACGHVSCFWCIHMSMSGQHKSQCPVCRNRYYHFPSICQTLVMLLLKMYPVASKRRENQILEDEKAMGCFSPQLDNLAYQLQSEENGIKMIDAKQPCNSEAHPSISSGSYRTEGTLGRAKQVESGSVSPQISTSDFQMGGEDNGATSVCNVRDKDLNQMSRNGTYKQVSVDDVSCGSCMGVLFRPIVLNCGHVFCDSCVVRRTNEILKCEVCESPHPGDVPKVCLEFDHFIEKHFPKEHGLRRDVQMKQEQSPCLTSETTKESSQSPLSSGEDPLPWFNASSKVQSGVGCDSCGMYPIIGDRFKCEDCTEEIGYDLCKDCHSTRSKLTGRFNQQHTADHKFEIVKSSDMHIRMIRRRGQSSDVHSIMIRLRGQLQEIATAYNTMSDGLEDSENGIHSLSDNNTNEDDENGVDTPLTSSETEANQSDRRESA